MSNLRAIGQGCGAQTVIFVSSVLSAVVIYPALGRFQDYVISVLIALGAGCLAGDSVFHLMPHALNPHDHNNGRTPESNHHVILWRSLLIVLSVYFFYLFHILFHFSQASHSHSHVAAAPVEHESKNLLSRSSGTEPVKNVKAVVWMMVVGEILHITSDGLAIGVAFSNSAGDGLSTSLAVFFHEVPHVVAIFAVFMSSDLPVYRALCLLTVCYLFSYMGMVVGVILGATLNLTAWIFAVIAGMFLYIALTEMFPEMFNAISSATSNRQYIIFLQNLGLLLGFIIMAILAGYEDEIRVVLQ